MNKRIKSIWDQAAKTHSGDSWEELTAFMEAYAQLVASDCIATIQLHMPRNGVRSPENVISKRHISNIAGLYGVTLPLSTSIYERHINDIIATADAMAGNGGYSEADLQDPKFKEQQSKYNDIISDGGMDPRNKFDAGS